ncbi:MAG: tripartite tricarboxylate transporter substrate-binding protein, partial [Betaproteobacteria bacterium]
DLISQVPTLKEAGIDLEVNNWWGLLAPAGTPAGFVDMVHKEVNASLSSPEMIKRFSAEGAEAWPMSRQEFERLLADDSAKWAQLAKQTGIKAE